MQHRPWLFFYFMAVPGFFVSFWVTKEPMRMGEWEVVKTLLHVFFLRSCTSKTMNHSQDWVMHVPIVLLAFLRFAVSVSHILLVPTQVLLVLSIALMNLVTAIMATSLALWELGFQTARLWHHHHTIYGVLPQIGTCSRPSKVEGALAIAEQDKSLRKTHEQVGVGVGMRELTLGAYMLTKL